MMLYEVAGVGLWKIIHRYRSAMVEISVPAYISLKNGIGESMPNLHFFYDISFGIGRKMGIYISSMIFPLTSQQPYLGGLC